MSTVLELVDEHHARRLAQDILRLFGAEFILELHMHRLAMADEDRDANAGRDDLDLGVEDLLGFDDHLPFLLGRSIVEEARSEERRVGKECVRTCRSRWSPYY